MASRERRRAEGLGRRAEGVAAWFLRLKGYRVLDRRARSPVGEIDLVVARGQTVAFVEVKARPGREEALEAVTPNQARRIAMAARWWLGRHPRLAQRHCRFDIVVVTPYQMPLHIENAFAGGGRQGARAGEVGP
jgi:putative endonuclease